MSSLLPEMRPHPHRGHTHFWRRALSRRQVVQIAAGLALVAGVGPRGARTALAAQMEGAAPKPIPGGLDALGTGEIFHLYLPEPGVEPSSITDFRGAVAINHVQGEGTVTTGGGGGGLSTPAATGDRLLFDADLRFIQGHYVGEDGQEHRGAFAFI